MVVAVPASTSLAPGGRSLAQMQREVLSYIQGVQDDTELNDLARSALNMGIDMHNSRNWLKSLKYQDVVLAATTTNYALASDVRDPRAAELLDPSDNPLRRLLFKQLKTFLIEHPQADDVTAGSPSVYTIMYDPTHQLMLNVSPDTTFIASYPTLRFHYHRRVPHLVSAGNSTGMPPEHDAWLVWYARSEVAAMRDGGANVRHAIREHERRWLLLVTDDSDTMTDWSA